MAIKGHGPRGSTLILKSRSQGNGLGLTMSRPLSGADWTAYLNADAAGDLVLDLISNLPAAQVRELIVRADLDAREERERQIFVLEAHLEARHAELCELLDEHEREVEDLQDEHEQAERAKSAEIAELQKQIHQLRHPATAKLDVDEVLAKIFPPGETQ
jgi:hypothetical protein